MAAKRIPALTVLTGAQSATDDKLVIFDATANETKAITRQELGRGLIGDLGGASGSFTTVDGKTVTVVGGVITAITT